MFSLKRIKWKNVQVGNKKKQHPSQGMLPLGYFEQLEEWSSIPLPKFFESNDSKNEKETAASRC